MGYATEELWFTEWENGGTPYDNPEGYEKFNPINHVNDWRVPMLGLNFSRSEEHTSELQSLMRISYAVFCLQKKNITHNTHSKLTQQTTKVNTVIPAQKT